MVTRKEEKEIPLPPCPPALQAAPGAGRGSRPGQPPRPPTRTRAGTGELAPTWARGHGPPPGFKVKDEGFLPPTLPTPTLPPPPVTLSQPGFCCPSFRPGRISQIRALRTCPARPGLARGPRAVPTWCHSPRVDMVQAAGAGARRSSWAGRGAVGRSPRAGSPTHTPAGRREVAGGAATPPAGHLVGQDAAGARSGLGTGSRLPARPLTARPCWAGPPPPAPASPAHPAHPAQGGGGHARRGFCPHALGAAQWGDLPAASRDSESSRTGHKHCAAGLPRWLSQAPARASVQPAAIRGARSQGSCLAFRPLRALFWAEGLGSMQTHLW